jgi:hypothetical protein
MFVDNKLPLRPFKIHRKTADEFEILPSFRSDDILARTAQLSRGTAFAMAGSESQKSSSRPTPPDRRR